MAFNPNDLLSDPLLLAIIAAMQNQGQQSNSNIFQDPSGTYRNAPPAQPLPPAQDLWATQGEVGGRGFVGQSANQGQWAGMTPEELAYNMQVNYARNQGVSAEMTDQEALRGGQVAAAQQSGLNQKYGYTDVLRQNAIEKRASEEEGRRVKQEEGEADRFSREAIVNAQIRLKQLDAKNRWSQNALDEIAAFARTKIQDPRTRVYRFPNDAENSTYQQRLQKIPGALEPLVNPDVTVQPPNIPAPPAADTSMSGGGKNTGGAPLAGLPPIIANTFMREVQTFGLATAIQRFMASPAIPQELKDQLAAISNGNK